MAKFKQILFLLFISLVSSNIKVKLNKIISNEEQNKINSLHREFSQHKTLSNYIKNQKKNLGFLSKHSSLIKKQWNDYQIKNNRLEAISAQDIHKISSNFNNGYYTASINIGTPSQTFTLLLDTGSSDLWATNYNPSSSSSFVNLNETYSRAYGQGSNGETSVSGYVGQDTITFGEFTLQNYPIAVIEQNNSPFNGIIGLSTIYISFTGATPLIQELYSQGLIEKPVFSFYLNENGGSVLILGEPDSNYYSGEINYFNLNIKSWWEIQIQGIQLYGQLLPYSFAFLDTGTPVTLVGPNEFANNFNNILNSNSGEPQASVVIQNQNFHIPSSILAIDAAAVNFIVLGNPFLALYYTVYDYENYRVGIATLNTNLS